MKILVTRGTGQRGKDRETVLENRRLKEAGQNVMADWRDDRVRFAGRFQERPKNEVKA